jgi:hypothetical protein
MFRAAKLGDLPGILRLYSQLPAWAAGCYKVMLMTGPKDPATHAFYRSCGLSADTKTAYAVRRPADWPVQGRPTWAAR